MRSVTDYLQGNAYPGRGILVGQSPDGQWAVSAYFIMGRSANSRNRIFALEKGSLYTRPFDASKVEDPSLIIYRAVCRYENKLIITNGDHTETVLEGLKAGQRFEEALAKRCFEPDGPNWTPRISGMLSFRVDGFSYEMSILKAADPMGTRCDRFTFAYESQPGAGHLIHTYAQDGNPLPSFGGSPVEVAIGNDMNAFGEKLWNALNEENKISLWISYTNLLTGEEKICIRNKNGAMV